MALLSNYIFSLLITYVGAKTDDSSTTSVHHHLRYVDHFSRFFGFFTANSQSESIGSSSDDIPTQSTIPSIIDLIMDTSEELQDNDDYEHEIPQAGGEVKAKDDKGSAISNNFPENKFTSVKARDYPDGLPSSTAEYYYSSSSAEISQGKELLNAKDING